MRPTFDTVLVVDDDADVRAAVEAILTEHGFRVIEAATGAEVDVHVADHHPDLVLLDLGLPDVSGLDVLARLTAPGAAPVIVLSGRSGETDTVIGLELGADDYISKPFGERELVARVNASLRRRQSAEPASRLVFGTLTIDEHTRDVVVGDVRIELTPKEFDLLSFLPRSPRRVFSRAQLLQQVWASSTTWQDDNTVAEHVHRIRRKLDPDDRTRWIETVRGVGYRFAQTPA